MCDDNFSKKLIDTYGCIRTYTYNPQLPLSHLNIPLCKQRSRINFWLIIDTTKIDGLTKVVQNSRVELKGIQTQSKLNFVIKKFKLFLIT